MNSTVIDIPTLQKLSTMIGGNIEDLEELVQDFIVEVPRQIRDMQRTVTSSDLPALGIAAHSTKSNARDLGAFELAELCAVLESHCRQGIPDNLDTQVATIAACADNAIQALQKVDLNDVQ